ncbi:Alpha/Beta hydrolase protein [Peziza echinospora]|nr:Alpha/Beta hydrolase protein [Peziza echinospora]
MSSSSSSSPAYTTHHYHPSLPPHPLHTLHILTPPSPPAPTNPSTTTTTPTPLWLIYIHGGAWRDPTTTLHTGHPLLTHLLTTLQPTHPTTPLHAASLAYRLSPGHHLLPKNQETTAHPGHVQDIATALTYLSREHGLKSCILIGHSAGACLAIQVLEYLYPQDHSTRSSIGTGSTNNSKNNSSNSGPDPSNIDIDVKALILLSGIFSLPDLYLQYPSYKGFIEGAFGPSPFPPSPSSSLSKDNNPIPPNHPWATASPINITLPAEKIKKITVIHSTRDELLDLSQTEMMVRKWREDGWGDEEEEEQKGERKLTVLVGDFGKHDEVPTVRSEAWDGVARTVEEVLKS